MSALFAYIGATCAGALAVAAAVRARRSVPRWAFAAGMAVLAAEGVMVGLSAAAAATAAGWQEWRLFAVAFVPVTWLLFSATYARGNGRKFLARHRLALVLGALLPVFCFGARQFLIETAGGARDGTPALYRLGWAGVVLWSAVLIASVLTVLNLERTFRASVGTIRWRIKFMLLGAGVIFVARIYTSSQILLFRGIDPALDSINAAALIIGAGLMLRSFARAGHFDLDVYPSQSVLQSSITVLVAGAYLLIVGVFAKVVAYFGGDAAFALKAFVVLVALVLLAVVLQSDHARLHLRRFVSRHFQRPMYDYRTVWKKLTDSTASQVEQADLCRSLAARFAEVFEALSVSLWVVNQKRDSLALAASTSRRGSPGSDSRTPTIEAPSVIAQFEANPDPIDIENRQESWAAALREAHPGQFPNGGRRLCIPMIARGELLGVILLGDRVAGAAFSLQEQELLKAAGDHAAASLMNVQLSAKLLQAKELEAFQAMAAFFVHDLKNAASTLNLMLQNLPVHYDNPEFREDALRGIAKTVTHIDRLIKRLSLLRHELKIEPVEADLNDVVRDALAGLDNTPGSTLVKDMRPLPPVPLDREQLNKVVTNLVLNATEAVSPGGRVRIATGEDNGWVFVSVDDNGCGMNPEFVSQSLFRPFQTTKANGLGIGMFQSKMIVEAHGGRIVVTSEPGKGTTFRVFLRKGDKLSREKKPVASSE
jgi:putative PEP-CTERM system histidine kinase